MLNQLNTTTKRELDTRYMAMQGSKEIINTSGKISIPDYGLTESIEMYFKPTQDLHGYKKPWAGGAGKNKLPLVLADIKSANTSGTWSGNTYSQNGVTFEILTDSAGNVEGIKVNGTASATTVFYIKSRFAGTIDAGNYILSKSYVGDIYLVEDAYNDNTWVKSVATSYLTDEAQSNIDYDGYNSLEIFFRVMGGISINATVYPMLRKSTETADFEPYSNICPIIGQDKATFSWNDTERTMNFGTTYYGGIANFDGTIDLDWKRIASYNGETLSGKWLSDRDKYVPGTTPTKGAEVVYKTTPTTIKVTKPSDISLTDEYPIKYNGYKATIKYQPKDTILEEAKSYTNQEISKLGLPQAPISNGNYQLVCTVSSGKPTISWETIQ